MTTSMTILVSFLGLDTDKPLELITLIICIVAMLFILFVVIVLINSNISRRCTYCHTSKTTDSDDNGNYQCKSCRESLLLATAKKEEKVRKCPDCSKDMDKRVITGTKIVADVCPTCEGIFLDKDKLKKMQEQLGIRKVSFSPLLPMMAINSAISR